MSNKETGFPVISKSLISELNKRWPELCAELSWDEKQVWFYAGQRAVIRFLNGVYESQQENF